MNPHRQLHKAFPTHCQVPTLSQDAETVITAAQLVQELKGSVPAMVQQKLQHVKQLQRLTIIIANKPLPRVEDATPTRVGTPTTSTDATVPRVLQQLTPIHQHTTYSNNPMETTQEEEAILTPELRESAASDYNE